MLLCRATRSGYLRACTIQHVLTVARSFSVKGEKPTDPSRASCYTKVASFDCAHRGAREAGALARCDKSIRGSRKQ
jgi:hypothetical protein